MDLLGVKARLYELNIYAELKMREYGRADRWEECKMWIIHQERLHRLVGLGEVLDPKLSKAASAASSRSLLLGVWEKPDARGYTSIYASTSTLTCITNCHHLADLS